MTEEKFQYLQPVPLHCFTGFGVVGRMYRGRYFQLHNPEFYQNYE
jgi:hypothetical protein